MDTNAASETESFKLIVVPSPITNIACGSIFFTRWALATKESSGNKESLSPNTQIPPTNRATTSIAAYGSNRFKTKR